MSDEQPEALRLAANWPVLFKNGLLDGTDIQDITDEFRRLHALCDEMGRALQKHRACVDERLSPEHDVWARELDAVITKWKESR